MKQNHAGKNTIIFPNRPVVLSSAAVAGKKEGQGPLSAHFDHIVQNTKLKQTSWEKAESKMQELALDTARKKANLENEDIHLLFAGDLLNQCIGSSFSLRGTEIPFAGLYGACSTMGEGLSLAAMTVDGGYANIAAAITSSHFATAERQYRFPLVYGGQRTPTAQWTVTGAGCVLLGRIGSGPRIHAATIGKIVDYGITDANNMGAAMAPAAYETIRTHLDDLHLAPEDYDLIVTGDLGMLGQEIVRDFFHADGVELGTRYNDCGCMIYNTQTQDVHSGGSGCGCSAVTLCGYLLNAMSKKKIHRLLFCATGALLSTVSSQQGESVHGVCHAVSIAMEEDKA